MGDTEELDFCPICAAFMRLVERDGGVWLVCEECDYQVLPENQSSSDAVS